MRRRLFLTAALAALPGLAFAQNTTARPPLNMRPAQPATPAGAAPPPQPITPENELERAFIAALTDETQRTAFRREFLVSQVSLVLASDASDAPPREITMGQGRTGGVIFTSPSRQNGVLGPASPRRVMTGRQALTLLRGKNVVLNYRLSPMLTLEPEDVAAWLSG